MVIFGVPNLDAKEPPIINGALRWYHLCTQICAIVRRHNPNSHLNSVRDRSGLGRHKGRNSPAGTGIHQQQSGNLWLFHVTRVPQVTKINLQGIYHEGVKMSHRHREELAVSA